MANAEALQASLQFCANNGIGCFRINNQSMALKRELAIKVLSRKAKEALIQTGSDRDSTK